MMKRIVSVRMLIAMTVLSMNFAGCGGGGGGVVSDTIPPVISNMNVSYVTGTSAVVSWDTNEPARCVLSLTQKARDLKFLGKFTVPPVGPLPTTKHQEILYDLSLSSVYQFQVSCNDSSFNTSSSSIISFTTSSTSNLPTQGKIVCTDSIPSLFRVAIDGSGKKNLFSKKAVTALSWFPDGSKVAFTSSLIYSINDDGSGLTQLTSQGGSDDFNISPDGTTIVYAVGYNIFSVSATNGEMKQLASESESKSILLRNPKFSSDGQKIFYINDLRDGSSMIKLMNNDGTGQQEIPNANYASFSLSPDGKTLLIGSLGIDSETGDQKFIVPFDSGENLSWGIWSPDSKKLALVGSGNSFSPLIIWLYDIPQKTKTELISFYEAIWSMEFSKEGNFIFFNFVQPTTYFDGDLWVMNIASRELKKVVNGCRNFSIW